MDYTKGGIDNAIDSLGKYFRHTFFIVGAIDSTVPLAAVH